MSDDADITPFVSQGAEDSVCRYHVAYMETAWSTQNKHPEWRWGQTLFNVLRNVRPDISEQVRGVDGLDPFFVSDRDGIRQQNTLAEFEHWVRNHW